MIHLKWLYGSAVSAGLSLVAVGSLAQARVTTVPDAQVESDVLKALAGNPKLAEQTISSNTVYGTVTLSGSVRDEDSRKLAETIVSRTAGVQKVVDELTLSTNAGTNTPAAASSVEGNGGSNPQLQSDGTFAPSSPTGDQDAVPQSAPEQQPAYQQQQPGYPQQQPDHPQQQRNYPAQQPGYGQPSPSAQQPNDGSQQQQPYNRPYAQSPYGYPQQQQSYPQQPYPQQPYGASAGPAPYGSQEGGQPVTIPNGSMLRVRINQGFDSKHTQAGTAFDAVVLNDVVAGGFVAIPRGATVHGTVVESEKAGAIKGRGELVLQLNQLTLAGRTYPITSDTWSDYGAAKGPRTVNSALGLGAVGAIIGGVAGGGAGAAIGAGVGGAAGVGASAASGGGQAFIPSEAILTFRLTQPATVATVSQAEMDRLGYGVPTGAQVRRSYARPGPYGPPVLYPRYGYPYPY